MTFNIIPGKNKDKLIVSFSGQGNGMGTLPQFEFVNFLCRHFSDAEKHFYLDIYSKWYHKGIVGLSDNIDETVKYLAEQIKGFTNVIFIGSSAGGYAAILFGSLLNIDTVIAFKPQTVLPYYSPIFDPRYVDLKSVINSVTQYYIYGDLSINLEDDSYHHISHCENIVVGTNVVLHREYEVDLKNMRDKGDLYKIMNGLIG
jgi:hypothetical protein